MMPQIENKTENDILNELKGINNFNAACEKIGGKVEENLVRKNIYVLDKNLNNSKTAIEAANILTHKQFIFHEHFSIYGSINV